MISMMTSILCSGLAYADTYIQHVIRNKTPFEFYYEVKPATEIPNVFSCTCTGLIAPGEQKICDCYSQLKAAERRYRMEYMKNISPTYRLSMTHTAGSEVVILWDMVFDSYWDWIGVRASHKAID